MVTIEGERRRVRRSLQEKKQLSYEHDRRNNYGENDKSSRTSIRRNKRYPNRSNRHHGRRVLDGAAGPVDERVADVVEQTLYVKRRRRWRKWPDIPLGVHVVRLWEDTFADPVRGRLVLTTEEFVDAVRDLDRDLMAAVHERITLLEERRVVLPDVELALAALRAKHYDRATWLQQALDRRVGIRLDSRQSRAALLRRPS